jgi:WD40 repeat protein
MVMLCRLESCGTDWVVSKRWLPLNLGPLCVTSEDPIVSSSIYISNTEKVSPSAYNDSVTIETDSLLPGEPPISITELEQVCGHLAEPYTPTNLLFNPSFAISMSPASIGMQDSFVAIAGPAAAEASNPFLVPTPGTPHKSTVHHGFSKPPTPAAATKPPTAQTAPLLPRSPNKPATAAPAPPASSGKPGTAARKPSTAGFSRTTSLSDRLSAKEAMRLMRAEESDRTSLNKLALLRRLTCWSWLGESSLVAGTQFGELVVAAWSNAGRVPYSLHISHLGSFSAVSAIAVLSNSVIVSVGDGRLLQVDYDFAEGHGHISHTKLYSTDPIISFIMRANEQLLALDREGHMSIVTATADGIDAQPVGIFPAGSRPYLVAPIVRPYMVALAGSGPGLIIDLVATKTDYLDVGEGISTVAASSDGRLLGVGYSNGWLRLFDTTQAPVLRPIFAERMYEGPVQMLRFRPDDVELIVLGPMEAEGSSTSAYRGFSRSGDAMDIGAAADAAASSSTDDDSPELRLHWLHTLSLKLIGVRSIPADVVGVEWLTHEDIYALLFVRASGDAWIWRGLPSDYVPLPTFLIDEADLRPQALRIAGSPPGAERPVLPLSIHVDSGDSLYNLHANMSDCSTRHYLVKVVETGEEGQLQVAWLFDEVERYVHQLKPATLMSLNPGGDLLATSGQDGAVVLRRTEELDSSVVVLALHDFSKGGCSHLAFSLDNRHLVASGYDGSVVMLYTSDAQSFALRKPGPESALADYVALLRTVRPDGDETPASAGADEEEDDEGKDVCEVIDEGEEDEDEDSFEESEDDFPPPRTASSRRRGSSRRGGSSRGKSRGSRQGESKDGNKTVLFLQRLRAENKQKGQPVDEAVDILDCLAILRRKISAHLERNAAVDFRERLDEDELVLDTELLQVGRRQVAQAVAARRQEILDARDGSELVALRLQRLCIDGMAAPGAELWDSKGAASVVNCPVRRPSPAEESRWRKLAHLRCMQNLEVTWLETRARHDDEGFEAAQPLAAGGGSVYTPATPSAPATPAAPAVQWQWRTHPHWFWYWPHVGSAAYVELNKPPPTPEQLADIKMFASIFPDLVHDKAHRLAEERDAQALKDAAKRGAEKDREQADKDKAAAQQPVLNGREREEWAVMGSDEEDLVLRALLQHPLELVSRARVTMQIAVLHQLIERNKTRFNVRFTALHREKEELVAGLHSVQIKRIEEIREEYTVLANLQKSTVALMAAKLAVVATLKDEKPRLATPAVVEPTRGQRTNVAEWANDLVGVSDEGDEL